MSRKKRKDPVGSTVRYEMMNYKVKLVGTSWYWVSMWRYWMVPGGTGSSYTGTAWYLVVHGQYKAFMPVYFFNKYRFGWVLPIPHRLTDNKILSYSACLKFKV